ncbi:MAG: phosphoribosyl-AMP cyclohydrolase [Candidatus Omnitrophica bacterium]|nr:phosphoribosyl-AMP cyclohydrolase [Candidatus Omnitrophota bacterium]
MNRKDFKGEISSNLLEESEQVLIDFEKLRKIAQTKEAVVPVVVQDDKTKEILLIGYANDQALKHTLEHKVATFWSTSRNELWVKGLTSGDQLDIVGVYVNCEQNSLLYQVKMVGKGSCHTKHKNGQTRFGCYYRKIVGNKLEFTNP